jgi:DNA polymerase
MSKPRKAKKNEDPTKIHWRDSNENKQRLYEYCRTDVETERAADTRMLRLRPFEQKLWHLDQAINSRGVPIDEDLCNRAIRIVEAHTAALDKEMAKVTDHAVTACSNVNQIKTFLRGQGIELHQKLNKKTLEHVDTLEKESVTRLLAEVDGPLDPASRRALELRQEAAKASVSKIEALLAGRGADGRVQGLMQYHAANTGRWAGRRFQPQNIVRPDEDFDIEGAIDVILSKKTETALRYLDTLYGPPLTCVSYLLRGLIKAEPGNKIIAADYAGIESRVLAWLAGEQWKLDYFRRFDAGIEKNDTYKVTAGSILGKPPETITKEERQVYGKVPELACGFQGGVGAFQTMAHTYGVKIPDSQAEQIKTAWRDQHPEIRQFWYDIEEAAFDAVATPGKITRCRMLLFKAVGSFLWMQLPSGRALCYPYPAIRSVMTPWGDWKDAVTFKTVPTISNLRKVVDDESNTAKWVRISTYGGSLAENATQAVARDALAYAMVRLEAAGYPIILHVHDEAVAEVPEGFGSVDEFEQIMVEPEDWMKGLPIAASGFESSRYRK